MRRGDGGRELVELKKLRKSFYGWKSSNLSMKSLPRKFHETASGGEFMISPLKTYLVSCDGCGIQVVMHDLLGTRLPKGWKCRVAKEEDAVGRLHREYCGDCGKEKDRSSTRRCGSLIREEKLIVREGNEDEEGVRSG